MTAPLPIDAPRPTRVGMTFQSASVWSRAVGRRPGVEVVDEHHAVPHEDLVLDRHAFADEGVALDLAPGADR